MLIGMVVVVGLCTVSILRIAIAEQDSSSTRNEDIVGSFVAAIIIDLAIVQIIAVVTQYLLALCTTRGNFCSILLMKEVSNLLP